MNNKLIKKLIDQAHVDIIETDDYTGRAWMAKQFEPKRLVELTLEEVDAFISERSRELPLEQAVVLFDISEEIKRHFYES